MSAPRNVTRSFPQTPPRASESGDDRFIGVAHSSALMKQQARPIDPPTTVDEDAQYRATLQERMGLNGPVLHFDPARQSRLSLGTEARGKLPSPCQESTLMYADDYPSPDEPHVRNSCSTPRASTPPTTDSEMWSSPLSLRSPPPYTRTPPVYLRSPARDLSGSPFSNSPSTRLTTPGGRPRGSRDLTASRVLDGVGAASDALCHILAYGSLSLIVALDAVVYEWSKKGDAEPVVVKVMEASCRVTSVTATTSQVVNPYFIAVGLDNGLVHIFKEEEGMGRVAFIINDLQKRVSAIHLHENLLYCGTVDGMCLVALVGNDAPQIVRRFDVGSTVLSIDVTGDGNHIAVGHTLGIDVYHRSHMATPLRISTSKSVRALSWGSLSLGLGTLVYAVGDALVVHSINNGSVLSKETGRSICALVCSKTSGEVIVSFDAVSHLPFTLSPKEEDWLVKFDLRESRIRRVAGLHGHGKRCVHVVLSPDGRTLVTASDDDTVRFWDVFDGFASEGSVLQQNTYVERSLFSSSLTGDLR